MQSTAGLALGVQVRWPDVSQLPRSHCDGACESYWNWRGLHQVNHDEPDLQKASWKVQRRVQSYYWVGQAELSPKNSPFSSYCLTKPLNQQHGPEHKRNKSRVLEQPTQQTKLLYLRQYICELKRPDTRSSSRNRLWQANRNQLYRHFLPPVRAED